MQFLYCQEGEIKLICLGGDLAEIISGRGMQFQYFQGDKIKLMSKG